MIALFFAMMVEIGAPGNPPIVGAHGTVDYTYAVDSRPVSVGAFTAFLNSSGTEFVFPPAGVRVNFERGGAGYVPTGDAEAPVTGVDWLAAARYVNWRVTDGVDTETGAYVLAGARADYSSGKLWMRANGPIVRVLGAKYYLPSQDEHVKASSVFAATLPLGEYSGSPRWVGDVCSHVCQGVSVVGVDWFDGGGGRNWLGPFTGDTEGLGFRLYSPVPQGAVTVPGDADADGDTDSADLAMLVSGFTGAGPRKIWTTRSDIDRDGDVDTADVLGFLSAWTGAAAIPVPEASVTVPAVLCVLAVVRKRMV